MKITKNFYKFGQYTYWLFVGLLVSTNLFGQTKPKLEQMRQAYEKSMNEHKFNNRPNMTRAQWKAIPKATRPDLAWEQDFLLTKDPKLGYVPAERRLAGAERISTMLKNRAANPSGRTEAAIANVVWNERGPNNVGGSTRALMFDPNDNTNKKVWAGVAGGGLWYTNDVTVPKPTWLKVDEFWDNLALSWITAAPNKNDFYAGTGEGFMGGSSMRGAGIWKSADKGVTWARLPSTNTPDFNTVLTIVVTGTGQGTVLAGTRTGIFRSTDGGTTWTRTLDASAAPYSTGSVADIEVASNGHIYASLGVIFSDGKVVKSTDNGLTWTLLPALPAQSPQRLQMVVSPTNPNLLYVAAQGSGTNTLLPNGGVFKTTDGGASWQTMAVPISGEGDGKDGASQAWIHLTLAIDPNNDNHVILGGLDLFRSTDGATTWTPISKWSNNGKLSELTCSTVHADQTNTMFVPGSSSSVLFGNDGGVYYTTNIANAATQDVIKERNTGYNVTQFYAGAINPTANSSNFLGGSQDNGTQLFRQAGVGSTVEASGGDGGFCFIDQDEPLIQISSYTNNNYYLSTDGINFPKITSNSDGSFINPADYDSRENILYSGRDANSMQRILNVGRGNRSVSAVSLAIGSKATHFSVSPYTAAGTSTVFIGTQAGRVFKVSDAHATPTLADITGDLAQTGSVSCIAIGASEDELLLTLSNYGVKSIWISKNGGTNWISKDEAAHGLVDIPVRWALFNPKNRNQVLIATELGVWSTDNINDANPGWQPTNTGLANTRMSMLKYRASDAVVLGVSYGRGLYTTNVFASPLADLEAQYTTWFVGKPMSFFDRSIGATSWAWNFGGGGATNATTQNPTVTYTTPGTYTVELVINGMASLSKSITNYITILPAPTIPYTNDFNTNGGGFIPKILSGKGEWQHGAGTASKGNFNPSRNQQVVEGAASWMTNLNTHHNSNTRYTLESPPFSTQMLPMGDYFLSFDYRALIATGAGFNIEYSTDAGNNWTILGSVGDPNGTDWYTDPNIQGLGGASGWFKQESGTIFKPSYRISAVPALMNQADLRFRYVFGALSRAWDGVQIDNFSIALPAPGAPTATAFLPTVGANPVPRNTNIALTFNKSVQKGTGNITINQSGGTPQVIAVSSAAIVVDGNVVTITLPNVLNIGATVEISVDNGAFKDFASPTTNDFVGIAAGAWTFTVSSDANTPPTLANIANSGVLKEDAAEQTVALAGISSGDGTAQTVNFTATAATSNNQDLLPNANISITYTHPETTAILKYTTTKNKNGTAEITVTLTDAGGLSTVRKFMVTVTKTNDPPTFAVPAAAPTVEQGAETQTLGGFATGIDDGDPDEEQELNFNVNVGVDGLLLGDDVEIFDEIDIDPNTGNLTYKLLPTIKGEITVNVQLFDDGEGEDPTRGYEADGSDNSSPIQKFKLMVAPKGTLMPPMPPTPPVNPTGPITVLGLDDDESKHITIYPNPAKGQFAIKYEGAPTAKFLSIYITNVNGQVVYQGQRGNFTGTYEGQIDLSDVASGIYIVSIVSEKTLYRKRLVITK